MNDDILVHYGVPGMKWGVRKRRPSSGRSKKKKGVMASVKKAIADHDKKKKAKTAAKEAANTKTVNINIGSKLSTTRLYQNPKTGRYIGTMKYSQFSDEELRQIVGRLNMEKQFSQLTTPQKKAKVDVGKVLKTVGTVSMKAGAVVGILGGAEWLAKKYNLTEEQSKNLEKTLKILETIGK